ncbi:unnamed protein product [Didymodactylos carnosus]|uniref:NR LBD domain-containing protein n=1 Tax=Didymodactylos carnosus TaxID=1234261 RepID=A0A814GT41_9BILA|nr:unnamed protein product [Didymodactylos carnosus]CAF1000877.1 unnamed protein product [Didymodactylos carnosus]CAF3697647.1 unnamed protein product [Didymodactylos carnosus]CAF3772245.1 unnamed protein product [Didymodactylos carnosus]
MIPEAIGSYNMMDHITFFKGVRETRKQLQLNDGYHNGKQCKDNVSSSSENAVLNQLLKSKMPQSLSYTNSMKKENSAECLTQKKTTNNNHSTNGSNGQDQHIPSQLPIERKHQTSDLNPLLSLSSSTITLTSSTSILNGQSSPRSTRLQSPTMIHINSTNSMDLSSPTSTSTTNTDDTLTLNNQDVDMKCFSSMPSTPSLSPKPLVKQGEPPRCKSHPMISSSLSLSSNTHRHHEPIGFTSCPSLELSTLSSSSHSNTSDNNNNKNSSEMTISSTSSSPDIPKIARSSSVKSCASDSGVSSSSPLSDNCHVHSNNTIIYNHLTNSQQLTTISINGGSRKRKNLSNISEEKHDKKMSTEAITTSGFSYNSTTNTPSATVTIPTPQEQTAAVLGYAQYASFLHTLSQQFRVNYPAALLHSAACAAGYLPLPMLSSDGNSFSSNPSLYNPNTSRLNNEPSMNRSSNTNNGASSPTTTTPNVGDSITKLRQLNLERELNAENNRRREKNSQIPCSNTMNENGSYDKPEGSAHDISARLNSMPATFAHFFNSDNQKSNNTTSYCPNTTSILQSSSSNKKEISEQQPYRRETYQTLLESSQLITQSSSHFQLPLNSTNHQLAKPVPIDLRKQSNGIRTISSPSSYTPHTDQHKITTTYGFRISSSPNSIPSSPSSSNDEINNENQPSTREDTTTIKGKNRNSNIITTNGGQSQNEYVCIPKKLMPVVVARVNDWLEKSVHFVLNLDAVKESNSTDEKLLLLSRSWHRLLLISMVENGFEIYVTKDLQINNNNINNNDGTMKRCTSPIINNINYPTENDVKQIESLISRGKAIQIDDVGFNLIREVVIYKEGKTLFASNSLFERAETNAQSRLTNWSRSNSKYSKMVFFLCNIYQVKEEIFEKLFCSSSMHMTSTIQNHLQREVHRFLALSPVSSISSLSSIVD